MVNCASFLTTCRFFLALTVYGLIDLLPPLFWLWLWFSLLLSSPVLFLLFGWSGLKFSMKTLSSLSRFTSAVTFTDPWIFAQLVKPSNTHTWAPLPGKKVSSYSPPWHLLASRCVHYTLVSQASSQSWIHWILGTASQSTCAQTLVPLSSIVSDLKSFQTQASSCSPTSPT